LGTEREGKKKEKKEGENDFISTRFSTSWKREEKKIKLERKKEKEGRGGERSNKNLRLNGKRGKGSPERGGGGCLVWGSKAALLRVSREKKGRAPSPPSPLSPPLV